MRCSSGSSAMASGSTNAHSDSSTNRCESWLYANPARWRISSWVKERLTPVMIRLKTAGSGTEPGPAAGGGRGGAAAALPGEARVEGRVLEHRAVAHLEDVADVGLIAARSRTGEAEVAEAA